ncbi:class I SAM-dependent methyltransferase [Tepidiforma sp.]|uniref:class I SAM-dependent methyltransferase n=1 Tax=Tepidiforma sp. TaxID=2682230 RepID=UPI002ADE05ED|nr:class I SAM-dependent methyltransferase [Tepidiforma sp.]
MQAPPVSERDPDSLARYLLSFRWPFRNEEVHRILVEGGLPLWRQVLRFVPNPRERGKALELGSPPFHITLLLQRFRNYDLSLTGYAADGRPEIRQVLESPEYGETHEFVCTCFNAEADTFPYPENTFDLVTWCEVIEHLTENPVHTLAEIHRVLKPGGALVISTPNACRADSIANFLAGRNIYDPYHLGAPLKGSRHSREYTFQELTGLLEGCGFAIERAADIDIYPPLSRNRRIFRWLMNNAVSRVTGGHYRYHLFVRARKTHEPFRWHFPPGLFDAGHLAFYMAPRDASVTFGINEVPHIAMGWSDLRAGPEGRACRRSSAVGDIYLLVARPAPSATVSLSNGRGEAQAWHDNGGNLVLLGSTPFDAPPGAWTDVTIPLSADFQPGNPLHIRLDTVDGVDVHSVIVT